MIRIGILGDIGSGKSYAAKLFGYPVFNADFHVAKIYKKNKKCYKKLKKYLPNYLSSFPVKKSEISKAIIDSDNNLKKIIKIIHPEVRLCMNKFIKKNKNKKIVVLDIPLLLENNLNKKEDILVFVEAENKQIKKRLKKRPNYNELVLKKLKKFQLSVEFKKKKSDFVIKNNFKINSFENNVKKVLKKILIYA